MNFNDILALAKNGYKPADIKELLSIEVPAAAPAQTEEVPTQTESTPAQTESIPAQPETVRDYDAEIKAKDEELEKLRAQLARAQQSNVHTAINSKQETSAQDQLNDIVRSFM